MSSQLVENTIYIPGVKPCKFSTGTASHFGRIKLGEIFKIKENLLEFVCLHCSQPFQNLNQFSLHAHQHLAGIVSIVTQPEAIENVNSSHMNPSVEPYDIFESIESNVDHCSDIDMASNSEHLIEGYESGDEYAEANLSFRGIDDDLKKRLADDNLVVNEDSPEAAEYASYLYDYKFSRMNGLFECPKCEYTSEKHNDIRRHVFRHLDRPIFTCTICNMELSSIRNHRDFHNRQNGGRVGNSANQNSRSNADEAGGERGQPVRGLNDDIRQRLAKENFEVDDSPEAEEYSLYMYDYKFPKTNGLFNCPICEFTSTQNRYVRRHIFKHLTRNIFTCLVCNMKVSSFLRHKENHAKRKRKMSQPVDEMHEDSTSESANGITVVNEIDPSDNASGSNEANESTNDHNESQKPFAGIDDHIKRRLAEDNFEVDDSPEAAEYSRYLFEYRFSNSNGLFRCSKCKYTSDQNHHVRRHIFGHLTRKIFKCTVCQMKISHISRLIQHKRLHRKQTQGATLKIKGFVFKNEKQ